MTRPDARLLVPVARAPAGSRVWHPRLGEGIVLEPDSDHTPVIFARTSTALWSRQWLDGGMSEVLLDLSRPDVVDGVPVRLDALAWALGVLGWHNPPGPSLSFGWAGGGAPVWPSRDDAARIPDVDALDLSGLSDDDASRAVVAAALRGGA